YLPTSQQQQVRDLSQNPLPAEQGLPIDDQAPPVLAGGRTKRQADGRVLLEAWLSESVANASWNPDPLNPIDPGVAVSGLIDTDDQPVTASDLRSLSVTDWTVTMDFGGAGLHPASSGSIAFADPVPVWGTDANGNADSMRRQRIITDGAAPWVTITGFTFTPEDGASERLAPQAGHFRAGRVGITSSSDETVENSGFRIRRNGSDASRTGASFEFGSHDPDDGTWSITPLGTDEAGNAVVFNNDNSIVQFTVDTRPPALQAVSVPVEPVQPIDLSAVPSGTQSLRFDFDEPIWQHRLPDIVLEDLELGAEADNLISSWLPQELSGTRNPRAEFAALAGGRAYRLRVAADSLMDGAGNVLADARSWLFVTDRVGAPELIGSLRLELGSAEERTLPPPAADATVLDIRSPSAASDDALLIEPLLGPLVGSLQLLAADGATVLRSWPGATSGSAFSRADLLAGRVRYVRDLAAEIGTDQIHVRPRLADGQAGATRQLLVLTGNVDQPPLLELAPIGQSFTEGDPPLALLEPLRLEEDSGHFNGGVLTVAIGSLLEPSERPEQLGHRLFLADDAAMRLEANNLVMDDPEFPGRTLTLGSLRSDGSAGELSFRLTRNLDIDRCLELMRVVRYHNASLGLLPGPVPVSVALSDGVNPAVIEELALRIEVRNDPPNLPVLTAARVAAPDGPDAAVEVIVPAGQWIRLGVLLEDPEGDPVELRLAAEPAPSLGEARVVDHALWYRAGADAVGEDLLLLEAHERAHGAASLHSSLRLRMVVVAPDGPQPQAAQPAILHVAPDADGDAGVIFRLLASSLGSDGDGGRAVRMIPMAGHSPELEFQQLNATESLLRWSPLPSGLQTMDLLVIDDHMRSASVIPFTIASQAQPGGDG
ncbi:MAG: hypothetical protein ACOCXJ_01810, partial [Planctomycetota bacterium]